MHTWCNCSAERSDRVSSSMTDLACSGTSSIVSGLSSCTALLYFFSEDTIFTTDFTGCHSPKVLPLCKTIEWLWTLIRFTGTLPSSITTSPLSMTTPLMSANPGRPSTAPILCAVLLLASISWSTFTSTTRHDLGGMDKVSLKLILQQPWVAFSLCKVIVWSPMKSSPWESWRVAS